MTATVTAEPNAICVNESMQASKLYGDGELRPQAVHAGRERHRQRRAAAAPAAREPGRHPRARRRVAPASTRSRGIGDDDAELGDLVTLHLTVRDFDEQRGALKPDARGRSWRGDRAALRRLLDDGSGR